MGLACPVCETPHPDAEHLANHLAFTAMLGGDDHEAWLDDHAPGWEDDGEAELADRVADRAPEVGFPQVFDDTTPDHDHDEPRDGDLFEDELERANAAGRGSLASGAGTPGREDTSGRGDAGGRGATGPDDAETQEILQEAREMTREMLDDESEGDDGEQSSDERDEAATDGSDE